MSLSIYVFNRGALACNGLSLSDLTCVDDFLGVVASLSPDLSPDSLSLHAELGDGGDTFPLDSDASFTRAASAPSVSIGVLRLARAPPPSPLVRAARDAAEECTRISLLDAAEQPAFLVRGGATVCGACATTCHEPGTVTQSGSRGAFLCACVGGVGAGECLFSARHGVEAGLRPKLDAALIEWLANAARGARIDARPGVSAAIARAPPGARTALSRLAERLLGAAELVRGYADVNLRASALSKVPVARLMREAAASAAAAPAPDRDEEFSLALFRALLHWFKYTFFSWVNSPPCDSCGGATTAVGIAPPTADEARGAAGHVEVYKCAANGGGAVCASRVTRFPRFNATSTLLETRRGRCGEWANAFTLIALAMGFDARYVIDFTDHVWTEVQLDALGGRWVHADACENALDTPLLYERGWGKNLSFVFAVGETEFVDVSARYTRQLDAGVSARRAEIHGAREDDVAAIVSAVDAAQRAAGGALSNKPSIVRARSRETLELTAARIFDDGVRRDEEESGRISGDLAWRVARAEVGATGGGAAAASATAATSATAGGWTAVALTSQSAPLEVVTSFGAHLAGVAQDGRSLVWRAALPATPGSVPPPWKPLAVLSPPSLAWPPPSSVISGVAAQVVPSIRLWVFTRESSGRQSLWLVTPGLDGDAKTWCAKLTAQEPDGCPAVPCSHAVIVDDCIMVLQNEHLARACTPLSVLATPEKSVSVLDWAPISDAAGISRIAATTAGLLFGYREASEGVPSGVLLLVKGARSPPGERIISRVGGVATLAELSSAAWHPTGTALDLDIDANDGKFVCLSRVGLPVESTGDAIGVAFQGRVRFSARNVPRTAGVFEAKVLDGGRPGDWMVSGVASRPIIFVDDAAKSKSLVFVSVVPATNVVSLVAAGASSLLAITKDGSSWRFPVPIALTYFSFSP